MLGYCAYRRYSEHYIVSDGQEASSEAKVLIRKRNVGL